MEEKEKYLWAVRSLNFDSFIRPVHPINGMDEYLTAWADVYADNPEDNAGELLDDAGKGMAMLLMFLYDKGYLDTKQLKELVKGLTYTTNTYGDFHDYAKELGIVINPK